MAREDNQPSLGAIMAAILLIVAGALLYFYQLDKVDLRTRASARIAVYAAQMNTQGEWLAPTLRGQARVDLPPLYLWAVKLAANLGPDVTAMHTRLPGALCALGLVLLGAWWFYRHLSRYGREDIADAPAEGFALLMGLMIASNPALFSLGRAGAPDAMFALVYAAAAFCWSESLEARRSFYAGRSWRVWIMWGYALAGVAMLVRGPLIIPLLLIPYLLAAYSYHLRRMDWVHVGGAALALAIGCAWPWMVSLKHPAAAGALWHNWLAFRLGGEFDRPVMLDIYLRHILAYAFPWIILAAVMAARVWLKKDRSPTLVFWACSLVGNLIVLMFFSYAVGQHLLPAIVFTLLLAGDGIYRWNFESRWARVWRFALRVALVLAIAAGIFFAALLNSTFGLCVFILAAVVWIVWAIYSRLYGLEFTPWETHMRLATMVIVLTIAAEGMVLSDWEPRRLFHDDNLTYFNRIKDRLPKSDRRIYFYDDGMSVLYDYYLGPQASIGRNLARAQSTAGMPGYLFSENNIKALTDNPRLDPLTYEWPGSRNKFDEGMFRLMPNPDLATTRSLARRAPLRLALLGNAGTRSGSQRDVARQVYRRERKEPIDDALLLGNNLYGPTVFDHLAFIKAFERPYHALLRRGVEFHALLGHEDQSYAWLQTNYPPFHMGGRRYYVQSLRGGLVDCFMLDSEGLFSAEEKAAADEQFKWLDKALADSRAPWKIVGLHRALAGPAAKAPPGDATAARLLDIIQRRRVDVVAWSGGQWYERRTAPGRGAVFLNCGWSGGVNKEAQLGAEPLPQARPRVAYNRRAGFVLLNIWAGQATLEAINEKGEVIDRLELAPAPAVPTPTPATTPSAPTPAPPAPAAPSGR